MLIGVYNSALFSGGISAIVINTPGTPASIATTFDGYSLTPLGGEDLIGHLAQAEQSDHHRDEGDAVQQVDIAEGVAQSAVDGVAREATSPLSSAGTWPSG